MGSIDGKTQAELLFRLWGCYMTCSFIRNICVSKAVVSCEQCILYHPYWFHPYFTPREKKADGSNGFFLRLICWVLADELSNYQCHSAENYFLFGHVLVLNAVGRKGIWKKDRFKGNIHIPTISVPDILRIVSYSCALKSSSSSIFLLLSSFTGQTGCQAISNLSFKYYQIKIAGTPLNSFWSLLLEFVSLSCLLCFPGGRVSQPQSAGGSTWAGGI